MNRKKTFLILSAFAVCLFFVLSARAAMKVDLNGDWQFKIDSQKNGAAQNWQTKMPAETETVSVPHTWNLPGKYQDHEGTAWYFKTFQLPSVDPKNNRVELHFGATFYRAKVWINGKELGAHEGGHSAYFFDITPHLQAENFVAVEINNQPGMDTIPALAMKLVNSKNLWYDWWHYGGIVRDVSLRISPQTLVRRQQIRTNVNLGNRRASFADIVFLENNSPGAVGVRLRMRVFDQANNQKIVEQTRDLVLRPGAQTENLSAEIENAKLWHFDNPNLYRAEIELLDRQNQPLDSIADNFGVKKVEIKNRGIYLNGERVRLSGMTRHETSAWEGLAETRGTIRYDYNDLKNLNVTLTRPVHYQQHPEVLDFADRSGILFIPEIPMWQFDEKQMSNPKVIRLAEQMMREMIEQNYNHPSIFAWSACNESATNTPGGIAYFRRMKKLINELDPDRFVTFADEANIAVESPTASADADFMMVNQYYGGWQGASNLLPGALDRINRSYPTKAVIISEFGTANVFARNSKEADEMRVRTINEQMAEFAKRDWIAGAILWCYQDYISHRNLENGRTTAYVEMGLVDQNRQRRPSYAVWQNLNSPAEIKAEWIREKGNSPIGFTASVARRAANALPSYDLRGYKLRWEARDDTGALHGAGERTINAATEKPEILTESFARPGTANRDLILTIELVRPTGFVAAREQLDWVRIQGGGETIEDMRRKGTLPPDFPQQP